ncbi:uncharacterized protein LOC128669295 [Plodia interpunctella]|uniref:uncharacterized protein LOC128669295 n=1 Tax=Plodia interpunctella TaxID=58824 RepID=UPI002367DF29|nr:uncharacterized protein LOC128669295 [Plodia interpunctella]
MRTVDSHLVDKMDEAVTHYINSHHPAEVHVDTNGLPINVQDDGGGRVVTVMHSQAYTSQMCRQVTVNESVGEGQWGEELLDTDGRLAALVAHLSRASHHHSSHHKMPAVRDMDTSVILDAPMRIFNGQALDPQGESIIVEVPQLSPLPSLQDMKRCQGADWFNKTKGILKDNTPILPEPEPVLDMGASASPANKHSKKSLPHKKRISRKLKRNNGGSTPHQDIVVINCTEEVPQEEILPDNFVAAVQHPEQLQVQADTHHIAHEMRAIFICQLCGEFYGEEQLKFFHHLKQHYEPHSTIIIENPVPVPDLGIDKMTNTCIVDNVATLPDSIVELSLENTVPKTMFQPIDKHILYTTSDKTLNYSGNKIQYSVAGEKDGEHDKTDLYETLDKLDMNYDCAKCHKSMKKHHRPCETHSKENSSSKLEDMGEFSEPEDLMEGIHVSVEENGEQYPGSILPHLTVENGHVHQDHVRTWYMRAANGPSPAASPGRCPVCPARDHGPYDHDNAPRQLKEEILQRMLEVEVPSSETEFTHNIMPEEELPPPPAQLQPAPQAVQTQSAQTQTAQHIQMHSMQSRTQNNQTQNAQNIVQTQAQIQPQSSQNIQINSVQSLNATQTTTDADKALAGIKEQVPAQSKKGAKRFECVKCGRVLKHRNSLLYHMLSHSGKQQTCRDCGKEFYTMSALKAHRRVHNDDRPYQCDQCSRAFRQWSVLKYHQTSIHSKQKLFKCDFCNKEFARKYSLNLHRRIHTGEYNYKCEYCNKSFRASSYRQTHMRTHTGDKPYKCEECEKCFRATSDLRRHIKTHEKMRNRLEEKNKPKPKDKDKKPKSKDVKTTEETNNTINIKLEQKTEKPTKNYAAASTTKSATLKNVEKIKVTKKVHKKDGVPNVTVTNNGHKMGADYNNVEVFDTRQGNVEYKFKDVYSDHTEFKDEHINVPYKSNVMYKDDGIMKEERDLAILRPIYRPGGPSDHHEAEKVIRTENTDGQMQIFTHVEKSKEYSALGVSRTETITNGEENAFLERLTALYNIPAI